MDKKIDDDIRKINYIQAIINSKLPLNTCKQLLHERGIDMRKHKITRITCDLDTKDQKMLEHCLKVFKKHGFTENIEIKPSPGGKGYHIIAWSKKGVTLPKLIEIRKNAGDDQIRCNLDLKANRMIQVLFTNKKKFKYR